MLATLYLNAFPHYIVSLYMCNQVRKLQIKLISKLVLKKKIKAEDKKDENLPNDYPLCKLNS